MCITPSCKMKIVITKKFDREVRLQKVTISLHRDTKSFCSSYNHTFDYNDSIKLNSAIWSVASQKVAKSYTLATVKRNFQGVKWPDNYDILKDSRGT